MLILFCLQMRIFLRCHETTNMVLAPKGVKSVGIVLSINEKG